jgi:Protein of unknown function (DUF1552)
MNRLASSTAGRRVNRRSFLRGAAGVSVALPFLESMPDRSAWAAGEAPVFALFVCTTGGVVRSHFFPDAHGPLTQQGLADAGKATSALAAHARDLLFVSGVNFNHNGWYGDLTIGGLCMALTGRAPVSGDLCGECPTGAGPSANWAVSTRTEPGVDPLVLLAGDPRAWGGESISFPRTGYRTQPTSNPYDLYRQLVGLLAPDGSTTPDATQTAQRLLDSRKSVHDLVREELTELIGHRRLSATDHQRLQLHFDSIRDVEVAMGGMANDAVSQCTAKGLNVSQLEALSAYQYDSKRTEEMAQLQLGLVALSFACNHRRAASLQWGNANDRTIYDVPSNARGWPFSYISHRAESESIVGDDMLAAQAHAEIDAVRLQSFAAGLDRFQAYGLADKALVMWTNSVADGPSHSVSNVPHIIWGNAGGYLKQGQYVDAGGSLNNRLLNALITAAVRDKGLAVEDFGEGVGGQLEVVLA